MPLVNTDAELSAEFKKLKVIAAENKKLFAFLDKWEKEIPFIPRLFNIYNRPRGEYETYRDLRDAYQVNRIEVADILTEARAEGFAIVPLVVVGAKLATALGLGAFFYLISREVSSAVKAVAPTAPNAKAQAEKVIAEAKKELAKGVKWLGLAVVGFVALKIFKILK